MAESVTGRHRWAGTPLLLFASLLLAALTLAACDEKEEARTPEPRPVRTTVATLRPAAEIVQLTGQVEARNEASYGFRIGGRIIERLVNVGDQVEPGRFWRALTRRMSKMPCARHRPPFPPHRPA